MPRNEMIVKQAAPLVSAIVQAMEGTTIPEAAAVTMEDYLSLASQVKAHNPDQIMGAITQLWGRTIFAVRPYTGSLSPLIYDGDGWALATRKINYLSKLPTDNQAWKYPVTRDNSQSGNPLGDGLSVDQYKISKDKVLETAYYGADTWATSRTTFEDQLKPAFNTPEDLIRFNSAAVQHIQNDRETWAEAYIRGILVGATQYIYDEGAYEQRVLLGSLYCEAAGITPAGGNAYAAITAPNVWPDFVRWMYGKLGAMKTQFAERNIMYTKQPSADGYILRHTPADRLKILMISEMLEDIRARVLSTTYNPDLLNLGDITPVTYWLYPNNPTEMVGSDATSDGMTHIVGLMFDRDALGVMPISKSVKTTPPNAAADYFNTFFKEVWKNRFDPSEKIAVLTLD